MVGKDYKAINFDLNTNVMKTLGVYPDGYNSIKTSMKKNGFIHRQGSGYVSCNTVDEIDILNAVNNVIIDNPWIRYCVNKFDVTNVPKVQYDLAFYVASFEIPEDYNSKNKGDEGPSK